MYDKVYLIPSYKCNLNCPHCDIHKIKESFNEDNFFHILNQIESKEMILFGGEPLLNKDVFKKCLQTNKITSVSSNLLLLDDEYISLIKDYNLALATSWNPHRFNDEQYQLWLNNLKILSKNNLSCIVLITLTQDLFDYDVKKLTAIFQEIDNTSAVDGIQFEHLVDETLPSEFHTKADKWLCEWYNRWNFKIKNITFEQVNNWCFNCSNVYTLKPTGVLAKGCPQFTKATYCHECLNCQLSKICRPCSLQHICSFPKGLYNLINNDIRL